MKKTLPVYYTLNADSPELVQGELTFTTLSVEDHATLEGKKEWIVNALRAATRTFKASMTDMANYDAK